MDIVGMEDAQPAFAESVLFGYAGEGLPSLAYVEDHAIGIGGPGDLGVEIHGVTVVVLAFGKGFFSLLAATDIHDGDGDSYDLTGFIARRLIGDEIGGGLSGMRGVWFINLESGDCFASKGSAEIRLKLGKEMGDDLSDGAPDVETDRDAVDLGQTLVDADVAEMTVDKTEADGYSIVDGVELGEALGG